MQRTAPPISDTPDVPEVVETFGDGMLSTMQVGAACVPPRGEQTIESWRRRKGLPYVRIKGGRGGRDAVRFRPGKVAAWCQKHGVEFRAPAAS